LPSVLQNSGMFSHMVIPQSSISFLRIMEQAGLGNLHLQPGDNGRVGIE